MACNPATEVTTDFGCLPNFTDPGSFVSKFYGIGLGIIGGTAVLFAIYGGYLVLTSKGDPMGVQKGRNFIMYAIIGLLLAVFGFIFVQVIVLDVLHIPGFK